MNESDKPPSGDFNSTRFSLYDTGALRMLCSGVGKDRFRTRLTWGIYCSRKLGVKDILEVDYSNRETE